ncbi:hypothetical protein EST38_g7159 [Candolleomyces aberdarensis]|uniref:Uncharacterized protein n=1 Tax=Candolleomyces aberdarensis TaxID=2316362 RepID=A0A4Q2DHP5_9AGAR|nr:hypothetical protein EST38_g7159 [Candolleomyces aberdarensis]
MPDAFFASTKTRKRKRTDGSTSRNGRTKPDAAQGARSLKGKEKAQKKPRLDEELSDKTDDDGGDIDDMDLRADDEQEPSGDEYEDETPSEKRLRLAKLYLESVKGSLAEGEYDAAEIDKELITSRLKQDVLEHSGKVHQFIADSFDFEQPPQATFHARGHRLSVTSSVASESAKYLFTAGKEGSIIKWDLSSGKKLATFYKIRPTSDQKGKGKAKEAPDASIQGHTDEVYSLAISGDGKLLASAGADRRVGVWDVEKGEWVKGFSGHLGHKDIVSNVAFKKGTNQLYSASFDRTVKVYDLTSGVMGYVETLFGHQDHILGLDALRGDSCVSVGARDKTVRYWKIVDETQLVFRGGGRSRIREVLEGGLKADEEGDGVDSDGGLPRPSKKQERAGYVEGSLDCVCMIDETTFLSGGDSGSISLWSTQKKKPIFTQPLAHGLDEMESSTEGTIRTPRWITSLGSLRYSDIFASGSWDGSIRIWKLDPKLKSFSPIGAVPAQGVVNSLQLISPPKEFVKSSPWIAGSSNLPTSTAANLLLIIASLGKEHRYGKRSQKGGKLAVSMDAGFAQGITLGELFSIHEDNLFEAGGRLNQSIGILRAVTVDSFNTSLDHPPGHEKFKIPRNFYARRIDWRNDPPKVYCEDRAWLESVFPQNSSRHQIEIVGDPAHATLTLDLKGQQVHIRPNDALLNQYIPQCFSSSLRRNSPEDIQSIIRAWQHFSYHLHRRGKNEFAQVRMELHYLEPIDLEDSDGSYEPENYRPMDENLLSQEPSKVHVPEADVDKPLGMTLYNDSDIPIYPYLFYFDPNELTITPWLLAPHGAGVGDVDAPLPPHSKLPVGYANGAAYPWQFCFEDDRVEDIGFFKLFLSASPANFSCIAQIESPFKRLEVSTRGGGGSENNVQAEEVEQLEKLDKGSWGVKAATIIQLRQ